MKNIYRLLVVAGLLLCAATFSEVQAQNMPLYTQYNLNRFVINPAVSGVDAGHIINFSHRSQWSNFPTAPVTNLLTYTGKFNRNGIGGMLYNDRSGSLEFTGFLGAYSYHIPINSTSKLSAGLSGQYLQYQLRPEAETLEDVDLTDPLLMDAMDGTNTLDASFGLYYYNDNGLYAGFSTPNIIRTKLGGSDMGTEFLTAQYYGFVGYKIATKNAIFNPSLLARKVTGAPFQVELNGQVWLANEQLMLGATYRTAESTLGLLFGFQIAKTFRAFYSYDASFNELSNYHSGSHEITLGVRLGNQSQPTDEDAPAVLD